MERHGACGGIPRHSHLICLQLLFFLFFFFCRLNSHSLAQATEASGPAAMTPLKGANEGAPAAAATPMSDILDRSNVTFSGRPHTSKVVVLLQHLCSRVPDRAEYRSTVAQVRWAGPGAPRSRPVLRSRLAC